GYEVLLGNGGSTFFWDAATFALIHERSQHVCTGEFGNKFAAAAARAPFLADPEIIEAEPGALAVPAPSGNVDAYAWAQNETSTGVVAPVRRVSPQGLMLVDDTSAAGAVPTDLSQTDAYYFAPQKAFASDGGLWFALCSPAALQRIEETAHRWVPDSLSLVTALSNSRKNQTLNTPAIATLVLMAEQIDWMNEQGGMSFAAGRSMRSAAHLYDWAERSDYAWPFVTETDARSPVVGTIEFTPDLDAARVGQALRAYVWLWSRKWRIGDHNHTFAEERRRRGASDTGTAQRPLSRKHRGRPARAACPTARNPVARRRCPPGQSRSPTDPPG